MINKPLIYALLLGLLSFSILPTYAQTQEEEKQPTFYYPVVKSSLEGNRYEIVVPTKEEFPDLFKIDKYTGDVWELSTAMFTPYRLVPFTREGHSDDLIEEGKVNYQLIAVSSTNLLLINIHTGVMWEYNGSLFKKGRVFRLIE